MPCDSLNVPNLRSCQDFARGLSCNINWTGKFVSGRDAKKGKRPPRGRHSVGRPPRHQGERLIKNRTFRVRGDLDEKLQAAAAASGRSVSEEIEFRLEQSFDRDALLELVRSSEQTSKTLQGVEEALEGIKALHAATDSLRSTLSDARPPTSLRPNESDETPRQRRRDE